MSADRYAYVIPKHEANSDADDLAFWKRQGYDTPHYAYLIEGAVEYTGDMFKTRKEAIEAAHGFAAEMGWARDSYQFSIDE